MKITEGVTGRITDSQTLYQAYRIFGTPIVSEIPLPELPICPGSEPLIAVELLKPARHDFQGFTARHDWRDGGGRLLCRVARRDSHYLLSLPGQANFLIGADGVIRCCAGGPESGLLRQLLLSQVLPRYLAHTGELLLHASAVTLPSGPTVAFLGKSGQGKSTLASYCHLHRAQLIDDDCILLRRESAGVSITGGVPTVRLYTDSVRALGHDPQRFAPYADDSDKRQMCLAAESAPGAQPRPLDALFLLNTPPEPAAGDSVRIEPATGQATVMAILGSAFTLDPSDPATMTGTFERVAQALAGGLRVYRLHVPRDHDKLAQVVQALQTWLDD